MNTRRVLIQFACAFTVTALSAWAAAETDEEGFRQLPVRELATNWNKVGLGEIKFADRKEIEAILERTRENDFPVRDIIHEVVGSNLFRNK